MAGDDDCGGRRSSARVRGARGRSLERRAAAFQEALDVNDSAEALDGLGRDRCGGCGTSAARSSTGSGRMRASGATETLRARRGSRSGSAREYGLAFDNDAASRGWLARAERLSARRGAGRRGGLARSRALRSRARRGGGGVVRLRGARCRARHAATWTSSSGRLAQLGLAEVSLGETDRGLARLDEAMAAATSGEPARSRRSRTSAAR